jgi:hypothetical protein
VSKLFNRQFSLVLATVEIATTERAPSAMLRIAFKIVRSLRPEPNTAEITVWNLAATTRATLSSLADVPATLEVGYAGLLFQIFRGTFQGAGSVTQQKQGVDWITKLELKDGGKNYASARVNTSFAAGTPLATVLQSAAAALGLPLGNVAEKAAQGAPRGGDAKTVFQKGIALSGKAAEQFDRICKIAGYGWSIQDGQIQLLAPRETLPTEAVFLDYNSGLIGSPELGEDGTLRVRALLQPGLVPGRSIVLNSVAGSNPASGTFRIERVLYAGDTWGQDWYADLELRAV